MLGGTGIGFFVGFFVAALGYAFIERRRPADAPAFAATPAGVGTE